MRTALFVLFASSVSLAQVRTVGDVIVVPDPTGSIHARVTTLGFPGLVPAQGLACQDASRAVLGALADEYDFLVVFLSEPVNGPANVPAFQQARMTVQNIGQNPLFNDASAFGSRATLKGCIFMGSARRLPGDAEQPVGDLGSGALGMTGLEVLGTSSGTSGSWVPTTTRGAGAWRTCGAATGTTTRASTRAR